MTVEPLACWRHGEVTKQRTRLDFAEQMRQLVDVHYPEADCIHVVLDNLNTHEPASLYEAFSPDEALRIRRRLYFHHTPKHASWLNMAEIEIGVLSAQCLDRRLPDVETLKRETGSWEAERNAAGSTIRWRFTVQDARCRLSHLYPVHS